MFNITWDPYYHTLQASLIVLCSCQPLSNEYHQDHPDCFTAERKRGNVKGDVPMEGVVIEEASNLLWGGRARPAKTPNYGFTSAGSGGAVYTILLCLPLLLCGNHWLCC
ncbi:unnamed protein product [Leuciscus chuanchicus]